MRVVFTLDETLRDELESICMDPVTGKLIHGARQKIMNSAVRMWLNATPEERMQANEQSE